MRSSLKVSVSRRRWVQRSEDSARGVAEQYAASTRSLLAQRALQQPHRAVSPASQDPTLLLAVLSLARLALNASTLDWLSEFDARRPHDGCSLRPRLCTRPARRSPVHLPFPRSLNSPGLATLPLDSLARQNPLHFHQSHDDPPAVPPPRDAVHPGRAPRLDPRTRPLQARSGRVHPLCPPRG